jgi:hypothetical protein
LTVIISDPRAVDKKLTTLNQIADEYEKKHGVRVFWGTLLGNGDLELHIAKEVPLDKN